MKSSTRLISALLGLFANSASAAPLGDGEFTRIINDVKILPVGSSPIPAKTGDRIEGQTAVSTGAQSRAEIRFADKTITRLGANSVFRMDHSSRTVDLEKGVILLQVPKQMGGAKVRTAAVTAAVTGTTILLEFTNDGFVKIIVIEGEVDVSLNERRSQFRTLTAGDMWISRADDKKNLPMPVQVDLERLQKTSKLLSNEEFGALGNEKFVQEALQDQDKKKDNGELVNTSYQIEGRGRNVTLLVADRQHVLGVGQLNPPANSGGLNPSTVNPPGANPPVALPAGAVNIPGTTDFNSQAIIDSFYPSYAYNSVAGGFVFLPGTDYVSGLDGSFGEYMFGAPESFSDLDILLAQRDSWFVLKGDEMYLSGNPTVDVTIGPENLILGATGNVNFTPISPIGGPSSDTWNLASGIGSAVFPSLTGSINFEEFRLIGTNQYVGFFADGPASDVNIRGVETALIDLPKGDFEASAGRNVNTAGASVNASTIKMSAKGDLSLSSTRLAASKSIKLQAKNGVKIANSTQLRRLSQIDNPQVFIEAGNGNLEVIEDSQIEGDLVDLASRRGDVRLANSTIAAREIKARVFDSGGTLILSNTILGNGTNPSDLIRLYGEGSNGVRFVGDTTLRGNKVEIAGRTVSIDQGSIVRLSNPSGTTIYSDFHSYNNHTNGSLTGLNGKEQVEVPKGTFNQRPPY
jgi:FecR protein